MSAYDAAMLVLGALAMGFGWWTMPRRWRGETAERDLHAAAILRPSMASRRGFRRAIPLTFVGCTLAYVSVAVGTIIGEENLPDPVMNVLIFVLLSGLLISVMIIPVHLFNWPKFVVPPPYRAEEGSLAERRRVRKKQKVRSKPTRRQNSDD